MVRYLGAMAHSMFFLSDSTFRADFECEGEEGGAVSLIGRFSPSPPDGWQDTVYMSAEEAGEAIARAVVAHFGDGIEDRTRLTRIVLHGAPTIIGEPLLWRYAVPLLTADKGQSREL